MRMHRNRKRPGDRALRRQESSCFQDAVPAVRFILSGLLCMLSAVGHVQTAKGQQLRRTETQQRERFIVWSSTSGHAHRVAGFSLKQRVVPYITPASAPFIAPIAPMHPLFANDGLFGDTSSSFSLHRARVRPRHDDAVRGFKAQRLAEWGLETSTFRSSGQSSSSIGKLSSATSPSPAQAIFNALPQRSYGLEAGFPDSMAPSQISPVRAAQIQSALVRFDYLTGTPTAYVGCFEHSCDEKVAGGSPLANKVRARCAGPDSSWPWSRQLSTCRWRASPRSDWISEKMCLMDRCATAGRSRTRTNLESYAPKPITRTQI